MESMKNKEMNQETNQDQERSNEWLARYLRAVALIQARSELYREIRKLDQALDDLFNPSEVEREQILQLVRSAQMKEPNKEIHTHGKSQTQ